MEATPGGLWLASAASSASEPTWLAAWGVALVAFTTILRTRSRGNRAAEAAADVPSSPEFRPMGASLA